MHFWADQTEQELAQYWCPGQKHTMYKLSGAEYQPQRLCKDLLKDFSTFHHWNKNDLLHLRFWKFCGSLYHIRAFVGGDVDLKGLEELLW